MIYEDGKMNDKIALTISLKYNQLKRDSLPNLEVSQLVDYIFKYKWKDNEPKYLSEAVSDIMNTEMESMVKFLSTYALIDSKHRKLDEFDDLFGVKNE